MTDLKNNLEEVWNDEYKDFMLSFYPESSPLVSTWEIYRMAKIKSQKEIKNLLELTETLNQIRDNLQDENRNLSQELAQVKKEAEFWKEEYVSHSETMCNCQQELQKTREQLSTCEKLLMRFVPDEKTIQWKKRELDAKQYFKDKQGE